MHKRRPNGAKPVQFRVADKSSIFPSKTDVYSAPKTRSKAAPGLAMRALDMLDEIDPFSVQEQRGSSCARRGLGGQHAAHCAVGRADIGHK